MRPFCLIAIGLCAVGCTFDTTVPVGAAGPGGDGGGADADPGAPDAGRDIGDARHLLLSEVKTNDSGSEFIEIYNPTDAPIDLVDYYLADTKEYGFLPAAFSAGPKPNITNNDFIARFPAGSSIASREAQTIAVRPDGFGATFGVSPNYRIRGSGPGTEMDLAFASSIGSLASLTDGGEGIALVFWDGTTDLVTDIDLLDAGTETSFANALPNKTGLPVDGPDPDRIETRYQTDLATMTQVPGPLATGQSYHRTEPEAGHEARGATGNGGDGHDETSEDIAATWTVGAATPGVAAAGL